jgi:hypothetical protein
MLKTVLRPIPGVTETPGSVVDVTGWRNAPALERARYLGPGPEVAPTKGSLRSRKPNTQTQE